MVVVVVVTPSTSGTACPNDLLVQSGKGEAILQR
jgi:hypothetical protein